MANQRILHNMLSQQTLRADNAEAKANYYKGEFDKLVSKKKEQVRVPKQVQVVSYLLQIE